MKILFVNTWMHPKNMNSLLNYKSIQVEVIHSVTEIDKYDLSKFDCVYSPSTPIDVSKYPNVRFIFGPHFSVFPDNKLQYIQSPNSSYIILSGWVKKIWKSYEICHSINLADIPFGVDTEKFNEIAPIQARDLIFIYFKSRHPAELEFIVKFLANNGIHNVKVFHYEKKYAEDEYIHYLQRSKCGIWIGRHESQGFALEEALSCNVPLFVWNVKSMNQEYGQRYLDIPATTIPYWDDRCGEYFYDISEFKDKIQLFFDKLDSYRPREFVLENLSMSVCEKYFMDLVRS